MSGAMIGKTRTETKNHRDGAHGNLTLCCLLGVCAWLLLGSNVFNDTIRIMMLVCTVVLGVATIGLLVAKGTGNQCAGRSSAADAQQQRRPKRLARSLAPTLDHTIRASAAAGHPGAGYAAHAQAG